jgi:hypothetical protein
LNDTRDRGVKVGTDLIETALWLGNAKKGATGPLDSEDWLGKAEAAALLGVHPRQLERRASAGQVRKRILPKKPSEKAARVVYFREDLEAIKRDPPEAHMDHSELALLKEHEAKELEKERAAIERERNIVASVDRLIAAIETQNRAIPDPERAAQAAADAKRLQAIEALVAAFIRAFPPPASEPRYWLKLTEAAEYSGLTESWLLAQARAGAQYALNVGMGTRANWRFNREMLGKI